MAFFFPLVFGQIFQSWIDGRYPDVVDWNNLYAHGSTGLLLLAVLALAALPRVQRDQRLTYLFFLGGLIFFHTRFLSLPPGSLVSYLPILSQQSPKHTNGVAVFCLVVAAAFGVEWLRRVDRRLAGGLIAAGAARADRRQHRLAALTWATRRPRALVDASAAAVYLERDRRDRPGPARRLLARLPGAHRCRRRADRDGGRGRRVLDLPAAGQRRPRVLAVRIGICALVVLAGVLLAHGALRAGGGRRPGWPSAPTPGW